MQRKRLRPRGRMGNTPGNPNVTPVDLIGPIREIKFQELIFGHRFRENGSFHHISIRSP